MEHRGEANLRVEAIGDIAEHQCEIVGFAGAVLIHRDVADLMDPAHLVVASRCHLDRQIRETLPGQQAEQRILAALQRTVIGRSQ